MCIRYLRKKWRSRQTAHRVAHNIWNLFSGAQYGEFGSLFINLLQDPLTQRQHWFRCWLVVSSTLLVHICVTAPQRFKCVMCSVYLLHESFRNQLNNYTKSPLYSFAVPNLYWQYHTLATSIFAHVFKAYMVIKLQHLQTNKCCTRTLLPNVNLLCFSMSEIRYQFRAYDPQWHGVILKYYGAFVIYSCTCFSLSWITPKQILLVLFTIIYSDISLEILVRNSCAECPYMHLREHRCQKQVLYTVINYFFPQLSVGRN